MYEKLIQRVNINAKIEELDKQMNIFWHGVATSLENYENLQCVSDWFGRPYWSQRDHTKWHTTMESNLCREYANREQMRLKFSNQTYFGRESKETREFADLMKKLDEGDLFRYQEVEEELRKKLESCINYENYVFTINDKIKQVIALGVMPQEYLIKNWDMYIWRWLDGTCFPAGRCLEGILEMKIKNN